MTTQPQALRLTEIKERQQKTWTSGNYARIGNALVIMGEQLCEAVDVRSGQKVLDIATGSGNTAISAARRFCEAHGVDYVPDLIEQAKERAAAEGLDVAFDVGDAENLPYPDAAFDVVLSTVGVMFTPDQEKAAQELLRVCKPGGKIGLANWVPDGYVGNMFRTVGKHFPPPPGVKPPPLWGTEDRLRELLGAGGTRFEFECYDVGHLYNLAFFLEAPEEARAVLDSVNTFHPLGRHGQPEDVVEAILFLASTEAGWITGTTLPIDGGVLAGRSPAAA